MIKLFRRPLLMAPVVAATCGLLLLAGCSSDSSTAAPTGQPSADGQQGGGFGGGNGQGNNDPGRVSGEIAAVDGKTLQIQNAETQTAVTYTDSTTFSAQVKGKIADIEKGQCVLVFSSATDQNATEVTATSVSETEATDNGCGFGFGEGGGGRGGGNRPSGAPSAMPSGAAPGGGGRPVAGKVTAVDGTTLTVATTRQGSDATTPVTVKTTSDTAVTVIEKSTASAAKVGICATANGKADDTGAVKATRITLRAAGDNGCSVRGGNR